MLLVSGLGGEVKKQRKKEIQGTQKEKPARRSADLASASDASFVLSRSPRPATGHAAKTTRCEQNGGREERSGIGYEHARHHTHTHTRGRLGLERHKRRERSEQEK